MSVREVNKALMDFLGVDHTLGIHKIEVIANPDHYPMVIVTRVLDSPTWKTEARMFELVPYKHQL